MATPPKQILPNETWFVTGRATGGSFRFLPERHVVRATMYCLGRTLAKYSVQLHAFVWMSNHYHLSLTDVVGELPDFMRDLNSMISRSINAVRGSEGSNFERGYVHVRDTQEDAILEHCAYAEANPCEADLVRRAKQWEGVSSANLGFGQSIRVQRPDFGIWRAKHPKRKNRMEKTRAKFYGQSESPAYVEIKLVRPPVMKGKSDAEVREEVRARVQAREYAAIRKREEQGRKVMGMKRVLRQHWSETPSKAREMFGPVPNASGSRWAKRAAECINRAFVTAYREAREAFLVNRDTEFPLGTWWMVKRLNANCASASG